MQPRRLTVGHTPAVRRQRDEMIGLALLMLAPLLPPPGAVPLPAGVTPGPGEPPWYVPLPNNAPPAAIYPQRRK